MSSQPSERDKLFEPTDDDSSTVGDGPGSLLLMTALVIAPT